MAKLDGIFDASTVPERDEFTPVPPGTYTAMVVASEIKTTSKGGQMIVLELDIQGGEHAERKLFERLNIKNDNDKAVSIAYRVLAEIVKAVGKGSIKDTEELHNIRLLIDVRVDPPKGYKDKNTGEMKEGKPQNSIKKFMPYSADNKKSVAKPKGPATFKKAAPKAVEEVAAEVTEAVTESGEKELPPWKRKK
ncbi:DUF669 domain-containing protein [Candidatus Pacearchaeota archaeon]|nr:DUF669 domain-containing protein [Candidatus Pacearchaeota archaeon]